MFNANFRFGVYVMHKVISFNKQNIGGWDHNSFNWMNSLSTQLGKLVKPLLALICIVSLISNEDDSSSDGVSLLTMAVLRCHPFILRLYMWLCLQRVAMLLLWGIL